MAGLRRSPLLVALVAAACTACLVDPSTQREDLPMVYVGECYGATGLKSVQIASLPEEEAPEPGSKLRVWTGPSGGMGSRFDVRLVGFDREDDPLSTLRVELRLHSDQSLPEVVESDPVIDVTYPRSPRYCVDGEVWIADVPLMIRQWGNDPNELEGLTADLLVTIAWVDDDGEQRTSTDALAVQLTPTDFVEPREWDLENIDDE